MKEFLRQVASAYLQNEGSNLSEFCFVFPNRRSSLFFKKYLGLSSDIPVFAPKIETISSLLSSTSGLILDSKISLLYSLYKSYVEVANYSETFDEFLHKGDTILNDFDDIDKYLVDAKMLFTNIAELREIGGDYSFLTEAQRAAIKEMPAFASFWDALLANKEGANEKFFSDLWSSLFAIYTHFREELSSKGRGYEGMIYREVVESVEETDVKSVFKSKRYVFVGFNALNNCEKRLLSKLRDASLADFYWDYYGSKIRDKDNMSSFFMEQNIKDYPSKYELLSGGGAIDAETNYYVMGVSSAIGQAKSTTEILNKLLPNGGNDDAFHTAVVLPDESLLLPVLNSIPKHIDKVNVTMGYSLSNTSIASFISNIADLFSKLKIEDDKVSFYHKPVLGILRHPFVFDHYSEELVPLVEKITKANMVFVDSKMLQVGELCCEIFKPSVFLSENKYISTLIDYQLDILLNLQSKASSIDREFIYQAYLSLNSLKGLSLELSPSTFFKLQKQMMSGIAIPFRGEPMAGLQIMGPLETRALDFDNLIILSVNEGTFPKKGVSTSLIPYNLRKGFGLPNYEFQDAVSAYHFYRSICRAKNVYLLYDTRTAGMNIGEESRFIKQLRYHHQVKLNESSIQFSAQKRELLPVEVLKTPPILELIKNNHCFSASSLETYLKCSLKFYYQVVEKIKEEDQVRENVEADMFGKIYHEVMENIYSEYKGLQVIAKNLEDISTSQLEGLIEKTFKKEMQLDSIEGYNKVTAALLLRYVQKTIEEDVKLTPFTFVEAEKNIFLPVDIKELGATLKFVGFIDRIDKKDGLLRIIDYKTGGVKIDFNQVLEIFDRENPNRPYTAFQLCLYLFLLLESKFITSPESAKLVVYTIKTIFKQGNPELMMLDDQYKEFRASLISLLGEIFDLSYPFKAEGDEKACEYCPYKAKCGR